MKKILASALLGLALAAPAHAQTVNAGTYNVEGILCLPVGDGSCSRIWLLVNEDARLPQMMKQAEKLEDVIAIRRHHADHAVFSELEDFFRP